MSTLPSIDLQMNDGSTMRICIHVTEYINGGLKEEYRRKPGDSDSRGARSMRAFAHTGRRLFIDHTRLHLRNRGGSAHNKRGRFRATEITEAFGKSASRRGTRKVRCVFLPAGTSRFLNVPADFLQLCNNRRHSAILPQRNTGWWKCD